MITDATMVFGTRAAVAGQSLGFPDAIDLTQVMDVAAGQAIYCKFTCTSAAVGTTGEIRLDVVNVQNSNGSGTIVQMGSLMFAHTPTAYPGLGAYGTSSAAVGSTFWVALGTAATAIVGGVRVQPAPHRYLLAAITSTGDYVATFRAELVIDTGLDPRIYPASLNNAT